MSYFSRYAYPERILDIPPDPDTRIIITIPAYREPDLMKTLVSLRSCQPPSCLTEVLVLDNHPASESPLPACILPDNFNLGHLKFYVRQKALPDKKAGVGLARKILMDEAAWRLSAYGQERALIVGLDADCEVADNYLLALEQFLKHEPNEGGAISYEHRCPDDSDALLCRAIMEYELHLRYYVHAQRYAGAVYAHQTVGSAMVVRNRTYQATGGMNTRKAGEDFYFLQKVMPHGFAEINGTTVFPSPRPSDRVPFGTGKAVSDRLSDGHERLTYAPEAILTLRKVYADMITFYETGRLSLPGILTGFFTDGLIQDLDRIRSNSASEKTYRKQLHNWFDGFRLMKCLHFLRENGIPDVPVSEGASWLLDLKQIHHEDSLAGMLKCYRHLDKSSTPPQAG